MARTLDLIAALACGLVSLVGPAPGSAAPYVFVPALAGQVAPDTGDGTYSSFGFVDVDLIGRVVFSASLSGGTAPGGLFTAARPLALKQRAIALVGDVAPGDPYPFPVTFAEFQGATLAGKVAFLATFDVAGGAGIYVADVNSGALTLVAKVGGTAPTGGVFQELRVPSNHCGDIVFAGTAGVTRGIFRSSGGVLSTVVLEGDPAPGFGGGTFESFGDPNCSDNRGGSRRSSHSRRAFRPAHSSAMPAEPWSTSRNRASRLPVGFPMAPSPPRPRAPAPDFSGTPTARDCSCSQA